MSLMIMQRMAGTSVNRSGTVRSVTEESRYTDDADYETDFERLPNVPQDNSETESSFVRSASKRNFAGKTFTYQQRKKMTIDSEIWTDSDMDSNVGYAN